MKYVNFQHQPQLEIDVKEHVLKIARVKELLVFVTMDLQILMENVWIPNLQAVSTT